MSSPEGLNFESIERPRWHYTYTNNEMSGHPVVFECDAFDILEADSLFEERIGKAPDKENHISCSIVKI
jgi:hypothetical protein